MTASTISVLIAAVCALASLITTAITVVNSRRQDKKTLTDEGENKGTLISDIGYIKAGVDELKRDNRENRSEIKGISERVTRVEESAKQAHKRIDEIQGIKKRTE